MCIKHYERFRRYGDVNVNRSIGSWVANPDLLTSGGLPAVDLPVRPGMEKVRDLILSRCVQGREGCWTWTGALNPKGYGKIRTPNGTPGRVSNLAHRALYAALVESPDPALHLDHLCRNRACVNPGHLDLVEPRVNMTRGLGPIAEKARAKYCQRGHAFDEANTYIQKDGRRNCRKCATLRMQWRREAKLATADSDA